MVLGLFSVAGGVRVVDHVHGQDLTLVTGCAVKEEDRENMSHLNIEKKELFCPVYGYFVLLFSRVNIIKMVKKVCSHQKYK